MLKRMLALLVLGASTFPGLVGCAAETGETSGEDEPTATDDSQAITAKKNCSGVRSQRTVRVKVMTINLRHDSDQWQRRFNLIADEIDRLDPDIIGLQEVEIGKDQSDALNDRLEARGHARYKVYDKRKSGLKGYFTGEGIAIMSRWPIEEKHHEDTGEMRVSILARVKHPSGGFIDLIDTHLDHRGGDEGNARRLDQARQTVDLANREDDCWPQFLTGDMNATETSDAMKYFVGQGFADSYRAVHGDDTPKTGNTAMVKLAEGAFTQDPKRRIDFVLGRSAGARTVRPISSGVYFKNHDSKGFYPSDHFGVMTTYEVKL